MHLLSLVHHPALAAQALRPPFPVPPAAAAHGVLQHGYLGLTQAVPAVAAHQLLLWLHRWPAHHQPHVQLDCHLRETAAGPAPPARAAAAVVLRLPAPAHPLPAPAAVHPASPAAGMQRRLRLLLRWRWC